MPDAHSGQTLGGHSDKPELKSCGRKSAGRSCYHGAGTCGAILDGYGTEAEAQLQTIRTAEDFAAAFGAPPETVERLILYEKLLRQWQKAVNLVAPATLDAVWHRHFADSAQLVPLAPPGTRSWIDLGSGAGFPGLVAAICDGRVSLSPRNTTLAPNSNSAGRGPG